MEGEWQLDMGGWDVDCSDKEGWAYAVDFPWMKNGYVPGAGKKRVTDFVRRRRWIRTRVPVDAERDSRAAADITPPEEPTAERAGQEAAAPPDTAPLASELQQAAELQRDSGNGAQGRNDVSDDGAAASCAGTRPDSDDQICASHSDSQSAEGHASPKPAQHFMATMNAVQQHAADEHGQAGAQAEGEL